MTHRRYLNTALIALCALIVTALSAAPAGAVCDRQIPHRFLFGASTQVEVASQVFLAKNLDQLKRILNHLDIGHDADLSRFGLHIGPSMRRFLVIVGRPRNNGCRETRFLCVQQGDDGHHRVQAAIAEHVPGCGCVCTDVVKGSAVFVVAVPGWVESADLLSLSRVHNCEECHDDCPVGEGTTSGDGSIDVFEECP